MKKSMLSGLLVLMMSGSLIPTAFASGPIDNPITSSESEKKLERDAKKAEKQLGKMEKEMSKLGMDYEDLSSIGNYYFNDDGEITLQFVQSKKQPKRLGKSEKLEKVEKLKERLADSTSEEFNFQAVEYSRDELMKLQDSFFTNDSVKALGLPENEYVLDMITQENRLKLTIKEISEENIKALKEIYGDTLSIEVNPYFNYDIVEAQEAPISRTESYNSMAAGIGIGIYKTDTSGVDRFNYCSTAGVATKGSDMWVMTAGHCDENNARTHLYQYRTTLGVPHLNATASGFDFLLIRVSGSPIKRQATNGIYISSADTQTGFDGEFSGSFFQAAELPVCKVGVRTNLTCGKVAIERRSQNGIIVSVVTGDGGVLSQEGDSGGAWFTKSLPRRLVGIHQGGNKRLSNGASDASYFTPWGEVANKYGLQLYRSSTPTPMN